MEAEAILPFEVNGVEGQAEVRGSALSGTVLHTVDKAVSAVKL